jgi:hypothetical protein
MQLLLLPLACVLGVVAAKNDVPAWLFLSMVGVFLMVWMAFGFLMFRDGKPESHFREGE